MPPPDYAAIAAAPRQLLDWLGNNLLMAGLVRNTGNPLGIAHCTITQSEGIDARAANDAPIDTYALRSHEVVAGEALPAYICNYTANQVSSVQLGAGADFCFTITLNGCTFGVGQPAADGSVRVSHANAGGNAAGQRDQTFQVHNGHMNIASMLEPAFYRRLGEGLNLQATIFGLREAAGWRFYFQLHSVVAGVRRLIGVFPFPT